MELARANNQAVNISTAKTVLSYTYPGTLPLEALVRLDLGSGARPILGGGNYQGSVYLNGAVISPDLTVAVASGVTKTLLMSRPLALDPGDTLTVAVLGLAGDTAVDVVASLRDVTPTTLTDVAGVGPVSVDHDYGGPDNLAYQDARGRGISGATIQVYLAADYDAGNRGSDHVVARTATDAAGRWTRAVMLAPGNYALVFSIPGLYGPDRRDLTVTA